MFIIKYNRIEKIINICLLKSQQFERQHLFFLKVIAVFCKMPQYLYQHCTH